MLRGGLNIREQFHWYGTGGSRQGSSWKYGQDKGWEVTVRHTLDHKGIIQATTSINVQLCSSSSTPPAL